RSYSDWELKDVFKEILKEDYYYDSLSFMPRFDLKDLLPLEHPFTEDELKGFVHDLQTTLDAFNNEIGINESTAREYISAFMKSAVCYIRNHINKSVQLSVEMNLDGSHGYGPVDYTVLMDRTLMLL